LTVTDIYLHDTYYVIGHFHYVVVTGSLMGLFGGVYHWFPKMFGRKMDDCLGKIHFWGSVIAMNGILMPMLVIGLQGQSRRLFDPTAQLHNLIGQPMHVLSTISAIALMLFQIPFIYNFFNSMFRGELVDSNPWKATTLDWDCPSPPPHGNFAKVPRVYRGPYEYSHPDHNEDWLPQSREHAEAAR